MRVLWRVLSAAMLALGGAAMLAWTLGVTASDRWLWSQYLSWLPAVIVVPAAAWLWVIAAVLARAGRTRGPWARRAQWVVGTWAVLGAGYVLVWELRAYRLPLGPRPVGPHLRLLHWNVTAIARLQQITGPVLAQRPDIAVLVNPSSHAGWPRLPAAIGPEYRVTSVGGFVILSRLPVVRFGMAWLGLPGLPPEPGTRPRRVWTDPGRAMFFEVDTNGTLGRTTIVWVLDLPSEPRLSRWAMARDAAATIREWSGPMVTDAGAASPETSGFPAADIVVGDFNIPRGAASLSVLLPGLANAYGQAGAGYAATWPRYGYRTPIPLVHIDQMFTGATTRAARYEVVDPGFGYHQMQVGDVVGRSGEVAK